MKLLSLLIALFLLSSCMFTRAGETFTLAWDHDEVAHPSFPITFRLESAPVPAGATPVVWALVAENIPTKEYTIANHPAGKFLFRCYAMAGGLISDESDHLDVSVKPNKPGKPRVKVVLQSSTNLKDWVEMYAYEQDAEPGESKFYRSVVSVN